MLGERQPSLFDRDYDGKGLGPLRKGGPNATGQSGRLVLYTPNTGLPDLELKIAYGLARVAFEAGLEFEVKRQLDGFEFKVQGSLEELNRAWEGILQRMLSSPEFFLGIPGLGQQRHAEPLVYRGDDEGLAKYQEIPHFKKHRYAVCGHADKERVTAYLLLSFLISKVLGRDSGWASRSNLKICKTCAQLAALGYASVGMRFWVDKTLIVLPVPREGFGNLEFAQFLAAQKEIGQAGLRGADKLGVRDLPFLIFSKFPHLADLFLNGKFDMALYVLEKGQAWNTRDAWAGSAEPYARFVKGKEEAYNPFNVAFIHRLTWNIDDTKGAFPLLTHAVNSESLPERRYYAAAFAREAVKSLSTLLPTRVSDYLLEEVAMIKPELYRNDAVRAVAALLRYFVNQRNFGFVDRLRSAKEGTHEFEEVIETMLRQARVASEEGAFIPGPEKVTRLMELAKEDFEAVKHALVILGLSWAGQKEVSDD